MKILLTNDDGISSPGLGLLAEALRNDGHRVFVLAPDSDRSGVSHAISFMGAPCKLTETGKDSWACSGTPADCVVMAMLGGVPAIAASGLDMVVSGINRGANLGTDLLYSGTAAAARQAGLFGIPALALSLVEGDGWHWETAVSFAACKLEEMRGFWKPDTFVNVNFPNRPRPPAGLAPAFPARRCYDDALDIYRAQSGAVYCFARGGRADAKPEAGSDCDAVAGNYASLSVVYIPPVLMDDVRERKEKA